MLLLHQPLIVEGEDWASQLCASIDWRPNTRASTPCRRIWRTASVCIAASWPNLVRVFAELHLETQDRTIDIVDLPHRGPHCCVQSLINAQASPRAPTHGVILSCAFRRSVHYCGMDCAQGTTPRWKPKASLPQCSAVLCRPPQQLRHGENRRCCLAAATWRHEGNTHHTLHIVCLINCYFPENHQTHERNTTGSRAYWHLVER